MIKIYISITQNEYLKSIKYSNTLDNLTDKLSEYVDKKNTKKKIISMKMA